MTTGPGQPIRRTQMAMYTSARPLSGERAAPTRPVEPARGNRFDAVYAGEARFLGHYDRGVVPWEIGGPQPAVVGLGQAEVISGTVLDLGCGTGDNALYLAGLGLDVVGLDASQVAIGRAEAKATTRGLSARFVAADASAVREWPERFETVLLSGVLHLFSLRGRRRLAADLHACVRPGGRAYALCFSERARPPAPRLSHRQITAAFRRHWHVEWSAESRYQLVGSSDDANAWLISLTRR